LGSSSPVVTEEVEPVLVGGLVMTVASTDVDGLDEADRVADTLALDDGVGETLGVEDALTDVLTEEDADVVTLGLAEEQTAVCSICTKGVNPADVIVPVTV
jgi:hypothetical protein